MATMLEQATTNILPRDAFPKDEEQYQDILPDSGKGPLLVATDATTASDSAMRLADRLSQRSGRDVIVLSVQATAHIAAAEMQMVVPPGYETERRDGLRALVREQLSRTGVDANWRIEILSGDPATNIVRVATEHAASLVIMGLGEHGMYDRLMGDETVLRVLRLGSVPVLAVAPGFDSLPRRVLATTDFTPSSVRAASLASDVMSNDGTLTLAHVIPDDVDASNWKSPNAAFQGTLGRAFDLAIARIGVSANGRVERCVVAGDPATSLLQLVEHTHPDLIVAGSHGRGFLSRLMLGSVSQRLVRAARCSVLVAPPEDGPNYLDEVPAVTTRFASYEWSERLEEFTRRNASRGATLEVIDPDVGAQVEQRGFPFLGASFDPRDGRVQIMLGDARLHGRHLTRMISGVSAVQVLRDRSGRDVLLRVAHGRGQTLLTLER